MTITEFAILVFKSPPSFSDPTLQPLLQKLSAWQSECSGFPLRFFRNPDDPYQVHLLTGWTSVGAHEAWIRGERNQELLRAFAPYVHMQKIRMVHLDMDSEGIHKDAGHRVVVVERYASMPFQSDRSAWSLSGRDLAGGDVFRFEVGGAEAEVRGGLVAVERWVLERVELHE